MGQAGGESFWMRRTGRGEHGCPCGKTLISQAMMDVGGRQQAQP